MKKDPVGVYEHNFNASPIILSNPTNKSQEKIEVQNDPRIELTSKGTAKTNKVLHWLAGDPFKKWFHSPGLTGFGLLLTLTLILILIPYTGFITPPAINSTTQNFSSTQVLPWDGSYASSETLFPGDKITFNVSSNSSVRVMIWNNSINNLPFTKTHYEGIYSTSVQSASNDYSAVPFFLNKGDVLNVSYSLNDNSVTNGSYALFIYDQPAFAKWIKDPHINLETGLNIPFDPVRYESFTAPYTQEWYVGLYKLGGFSPISLRIYYSITALDVAHANVNILNTHNMSKYTYNVQSKGNYTFLLLNSPSNSNTKQSVWVSTSGAFYKNLNEQEFWKNSEPSLVFVAIIFFSLIMMTVLERSNIRKISKRMQDKQTIKKQDPSTHVSLKSCRSCKAVNSIENFYCEHCGSKLKKGNYKFSNQNQASKNHYCSVCGSGLHIDSKYCPQCGNDIE